MGFTERSSATPFTPKELLELPRPGAGVANSKGDLALVVVSTHSFQDKKTSKSIHIVPLTHGSLDANHQTLEGATAFWLDSRTICHVVTKEDTEEQELFAVSVQASEEVNSLSLKDPVSIGRLPPAADASNFKYSNGYLVFSSYVFSDEDIHTIKKQDDELKARETTAFVYDSLYVRHWDKYLGPKKSTIFAVKLTNEDKSWKLGSNYLAPLKGTKHYVPVEPFGGEEDFDVNGEYLVYTTKDPSINEATHTRQNIYLTSLDGSSSPKHLTTGKQGATHSPVFSPDGSKVAWLEMAEDGYEADEQRVVVYDHRVDVTYKLDYTRNVTIDGVEVQARWDRSPDSIKFTPDGKHLVFTAGDNAHVKVFTAPLPSTPKPASTSHGPFNLVGPVPRELTPSHAASAAQPLPDGRILYTESSLNGPNNLFILSPSSSSSSVYERNQITQFGQEVLKEKVFSPYESFWFEGAEGVRVQGWAVRPFGWKEGEAKKWPGVLMIHGGPQGAWEDQWSTRWNPQVWAQHGYFVILINPTGSTTFGQALTDAIKEDWGGKPIIDLSKGFAYALQHYPEIDSSRVAAAGASYGGYAVNWIAGNMERYGFPQFKALVTHDGLFDTRSGGYTTEELFFWIHEFGGSPDDEKARATAEKWNPVNYVKNWNSPHLIIHGSRDFRLAETDGLSAFTALQIRNVPSRLVIFPDENHWVLKPSNSLKWHEEVFGWLDSHLGV